MMAPVLTSSKILYYTYMVTGAYVNSQQKTYNNRMDSSRKSSVNNVSRPSQGLGACVLISTWPLC